MIARQQVALGRDGDRVALVITDPDGGEITIEAVLLAADPEDGGGLVLHVALDAASGLYPRPVRVYAGEAEEADIEYDEGVWT